MGSSSKSRGVSRGGNQGQGIDTAAVQFVLDFQRTGRGFKQLWHRVGPTVDGMLRRQLRTRSVKGHRGGDDDVAVADTTQQVMSKLWEVPGKGPQAWFDPGRKQCAVDALRAWLFGFCRHAVSAYCKQWRGARRRRKVVAESGLPLNEQTEFSSILKSIPAKIEVNDRELREIVNACVDSLDDDLRKLLRLNRWEGLSERDIADTTGIHVSTVHRRLGKAVKEVAKKLAARGVDETWLDGSA